MTPHTSIQSSLVILSAIIFSAPAIATTQTPAAKPAPISCSIRHTPSSPGDIAYSHGKWSDAADLYRKEDQAAGVDGERTHNALIRTLLHAGKVADAETDAKDWVAKSPKDAWAMDALGQVQFRKGEIDAAGQTFRDAAAIDFCVAAIHIDYARYLAFTGFHASSKAQFEIAHKLDPVDNEISIVWVHMQPRTTRLAALNDYLSRNTSLTDTERKRWETEKTFLSGPPIGACRLSKPLTSTIIPLKIAEATSRTETRWGLDVKFNGTTRRLDLDTGAHGLLLTRSAAAALGLEVIDHSKTGGIGDEGAVTSSIARVASIKIGELEFQDCVAVIVDQHFEHHLAGDGLVGADVFQNYLTTIDFPGRTLKIDPLPVPPGKTADTTASMQTGVEDNAGPHDRYIDPSMASWTKVFRTGHELFVPVRLNSGPVHLFLVDTGAFDDSVSPKAAAEVGKVQKGLPTGVVGIAGEVKDLYLTAPLTLDFAGLRQPSDGLIGMDTEHLTRSSGTNISGILGSRSLHQLTLRIDYRDQLVQFIYDPSRVAHCAGSIKVQDCY